MTGLRPLPDLGDPLMAPFWIGLGGGEVLLQRCVDCGAWRLPASELCPLCWSRQGEWSSVAPEGVIWSFTTYYRALHPGFVDEVPYTVALVELEVGVRLPGRLHVAADGDVEIGDRVVGVFEEVGPGVTILSWKRGERSR